MAFRKLGEFIKLVSERNINGQFSEVLGISIDKEFMPSVANIIGTDLTKYYVIRKNRFAFNPMHVGRDERLPISCYKRENPALVSPAYQMFEITDDNINSDYLMLVFKSSEFDRNCWFHTDSSVRGGISWNDFCKMEINVPDIAEQERVVKIYNVINNRIKILNALNKNLEEQAQTIFKHWFIDFEFPNEEGLPYKSSAGKMIWNEELQKEIPEDWKSGKLGEIAEIKRGSSPRPIQKFLSSKGFNWLKISDVTNLQSPFVIDIKEHIIETGLKNTVYLKKGSLVLSNSATPGIPKILDVDSCIHDGWLYFSKSYFSNEYLYLLFLNIRDNLIKLSNGTIFNNLKTDILKKYFVVLPKEKILKSFNRLVTSLFTIIRNLARESQKLAEILELLLPKLLS